MFDFFNTELIEIISKRTFFEVYYSSIHLTFGDHVLYEILSSKINKLITSVSLKSEYVSLLLFIMNMLKLCLNLSLIK
jgi:hypothetical protein